MLCIGHAQSNPVERHKLFYISRWIFRIAGFAGISAVLSILTFRSIDKTHEAKRGHSPVPSTIDQDLPKTKHLSIKDIVKQSIKESIFNSEAVIIALGMFFAMFGNTKRSFILTSLFTLF